MKGEDYLKSHFWVIQIQTIVLSMKLMNLKLGSVRKFKAV